ncbi:uncharacterized protein LOC109545713 [Dendroctonus ponderosae]|uniref:uncharacterized protein LOC109545713 n=1 Tax=Dendroctonus ponderosae TaxID=77166 RepID=UPI0020350165|nr:uncharacterized protein LOC109545713 [Dendroctonus ponderosae]XP_019772112.2 uncharacterized protein LOC109545713 [Dendroctonus ponderosae]XP_048520466.1 uncharacterized protein LOC109545713 [Dendroctonus ponderosae]XP_048520468.1 uncharacterized protein LOC109545713 [Dendroctonus ponderosae]KAH1024083.1 hypothetical protein HUJ05_003642 [Dendroctonus ponderosae]KAH1024084.1 hypothetical protein HUJ05_003642 [Dendroctonus ponderosae]KAH1024085.1 hypothetical protein HUJ05_003642 [Dendrocto
MADNEELQIDEQDENTTTVNFKPSFVLIAIDTHSSMFHTKKNDDDDDDETHAFKDALKACYEIADSLVLSTSRSNYNQFGIVLADEDQKASFIDVQNNLIDSIKFLKDKCSQSNEQLKANYERYADLDLAGFFLLCKKKFREISSAYYKRTLIYITNDDNPTKEDKQKKFTALSQAKSFEPNDINFKLVTMNKNFEISKFYNELFYLSSKGPITEELCLNKNALVEALSSKIILAYTKHKFNFYPFKGDRTRFLKVMRVNFIREAKLSNIHKASHDGKQLVKVKENASAQEPVRFRLQLNNEKIIELDSKDKYSIIANNLPLGFHLQYVSDRHSNFGIVIDQVSLLLLDPKEELDQHFNQFWLYCIEKNKVLVCLKKYRHPSEIRYVELIPKYANKQRLFLIKDIPFCEEYHVPRAVHIEKALSSNIRETQKQAIRDLIEKLSFDYEPTIFINPSYAKKKAYVKAKLLELPEEIVEDTTSNADQIDEQITEIVVDFQNLFNVSFAVQGQKRKLPTSRITKRQK